MGINSGWFFGDSFLYGYQCHPGDPYYEVSNNKDKRIASQIICDKLKLKHFNLSQYGFSNGNIIHTIFKNIKKIKEALLVVKKLPDVFIGKISAKNKNMKGIIKLSNLTFFKYFK